MTHRVHPQGTAGRSSRVVHSRRVGRKQPEIHRAAALRNLQARLRKAARQQAGQTVRDSRHRDPERVARYWDSAADQMLLARDKPAEPRTRWARWRPAGVREAVRRLAEAAPEASSPQMGSGTAAAARLELAV